MFPNSIHPMNTPFMPERVKAISAFVDIDIIAPVSYFPLLRSKLPPQNEIFKGLRLYHPRYLALPRQLWGFRWIPYMKMLNVSSLYMTLTCDILHFEWIYPDAYAAVKFAKNRGIKTVGVVHGNEAIDYYGPQGYRKKYIEAFAALDKIIVVSADLKDKLINEYCVDPGKISIILNGVDVNKFPVVDKKNARKKLGLSMKSSIGVCVARLSEEKNLNILIQSVAKLQERSPIIYIIGDGPLKKELIEQIDHYGVGKWVKLVGPVAHEKVSLWLGACDFFCLPSQREGCPVVIHEALACGRPVISTTVGAIPDLVCHEDYGLLCPPSDVDALSDLLDQALVRTWNSDKISAYGRQFTWEKVAEQTVEVFHELLKDNQ